MSNYILVLDHGTTGLKACLMNQAGDITAQAYEKIPQFYPQPGWVEHDPAVLWELTLQAIQTLFKGAGITWSQIVSVGITNQRETVVLWDKTTGAPLYNAIVWQCRRTAEWCSDRKQQDASLIEDIHARTGLVMDAYFSASKIRWLLDHSPAAQSALAAGNLLCGTVDTWILWKLTGHRKHITDMTNASRTMLFNIRTKAWDSVLLSYFGIPESILPSVQTSCSHFGDVDPGLTQGAMVPIMSMIGDQQSALYGERCWTPGTSKNTFGTGAFLMTNIGTECILSNQGLLTTLACGADGNPVYALEGSVFMAGAVMEWLKNDLGLFDTFDEADSLAMSIESTEGVYLVPAFVGLGAPHWDSDARGLLCGLTQGAGRAHLTRAGLESMAYQVDDILALMQQASGASIAHLKVDGGVSRSNFLMQFLADVLNLPVHRMLDTELTAKGAGYLAGLGAHFWESPEAIAALPQPEDIFPPTMAPHVRGTLKQGWQAAIQRTLLTPEAAHCVGEPVG